MARAAAPAAGRPPRVLGILPCLLGVWTMLVLLHAAGHPVHAERILGNLVPPVMAQWTWRRGGGALWRHLGHASWLLPFGLAYLGAGAAVVAWLGGRLAGDLRRHASWIAGTAAASLTVLGLGLAGLLHAATLGAPGTAAVVLGLRALLVMRRPAGAPPGGAGRGTAWSAVLGTAAVTGCVVSLLAALAPQIGLDALAHYYAAPRRAIELHRYVVETQVFPDGYPHGFEMLFIPALLAGGEGAAKLLTWAELALAGAALSGLLRHLGAGRDARYLALGLYWTLPYTGYLTQVSTGDGAVAHAAIAGLWFLRAGRWRPVAFVAGWMLSLKISAALVAAPLLALAAAAAPGRWAEFVVFGSVCGLPWWFRNFFGHGQPFFPLLGNVQPTFETTWLLDPAADLAGLVKGSRDASVLDRLGRAWGAHLGRDVVGVTAFAVVWLLPVALSGAPRRAAVFLAGGAGLWAASRLTILRYLHPLAAPVLAEAASALDRRRATRMACVLAALFAVQGLAEGEGWRWANPLGVVAGAELPSTYLRRVLPPVPCYMTIGEASRGLFRGGRTYVLGDMKAYYWAGEFLIDDPRFRSRLSLWIRESASADRLAIRIRQAGVRHLVYRADGMAPHADQGQHMAFSWSPARLGWYQAFWDRHMLPRGELVSRHDGTFYYFFDVLARAPAVRPVSAPPFTLPGTERLTWPGDLARLRGDTAAARRWFRRVAREYPGFRIARERVAELAGEP